MKAFVPAILLPALSSSELMPVVRRTTVRLGAVSNEGGRNVTERTVAWLRGLAISLVFLLITITAILTANATVPVRPGDWPRVASILSVALLSFAIVEVLDETSHNGQSLMRMQALRCGCFARYTSGLLELADRLAVRLRYWRGCSSPCDNRIALPGAPPAFSLYKDRNTKGHWRSATYRRSTLCRDGETQ